MSRQEKRVLSITLTIAALLVVLSGCAFTSPARVVKPGDQATVNYTCHLKSGEIVATTYERVAKDSSLHKSSIFHPKKDYDPESLKAGGVTAGLRPTTAGVFEQEVRARLAEAVVGLREGESRTLELFAGDVPGMRDDERIIRMARVRRRPRVMRMTNEEYTRRMGKAPEVGQKVVFDPAIPGEVTSVTETEVVVRFLAEPGAEVDTPFGKGVIGDKDGRYEIVIDADAGKLVRSGPIVGRIVGVDERFITIDYGDPFGGEALVCDVRVESVAPATGSPQEGRLAEEPR